MVVKTAQATDRVDKMSQKFGLSRKGFQEWDYILSQNGATIDSMTSGMKTLTNMTDDLMKGNKKATDSFKRLGISMEDVEGKSQEEVFEMTVKALQGMENATERAAIANDLLGRSGIELAPLLNAGADSVDKLKKQANELGLVMGDEAIDAGVMFTDTMDTLKRSFGAVFLEIGTKVMPIFQRLAEWVIDNMPMIRETMQTVFEVITKVVTTTIEVFEVYFLPILEKIFDWLVENWWWISATAETAFKIIMAVVKLAVDVIITTFNVLGKFVSTIVKIFTAIKDAIVKPFDVIKKAGDDLWAKMKDVFGKIGGFVKGVFDSFRNIIQLPKFEVKGSLNPLTWLKDGLPKLNVIWGKSSVNVDDYANKLSAIKWNADGAIFSRPTIFGTSAGFQGVGEAGSEIVAPLSKLQDMIDWNRMDEESLAKAIRKELTGFAVVLDDEKVGEFVDLRIIKGVS